MSNREELLKQQRAQGTHEERQTIALEGIYDMLTAISARIGAMDNTSSSIARSMAQISSVMKSPAFNKR